LKPRIALIGPVLPFRGGIAQHTTMLHRSLAKKADLLTISFTRQYPAWLFPGESDKDPAYENYREPGVQYLIDSLNPLSWEDAIDTVRTFAPSAIVFPWWTVFWTFCFHHIASAVKRPGTRVVFLCHNAVEHESALWKRHLTSWVFKTANQFVVHTQSEKANIRNLIPEAQVRVYPHPIYDQYPSPSSLGTLPRRAELELLFFGFVRRYKGIDVLLDALALIRDESVKLTIAGEFWEGERKTREKITFMGLREIVEILPRYQTERETAELFGRADVVVLPYRSATGTGVVPLAYHYNKPVVVTRVGGLPDVVDENLTGFVVPPEAPHELACALRRCLHFRPQAEHFTAVRKRMSWQGLATTLIIDS
jgi:glycosyltransferase involved in cell wall biosynthesis